MITSFIIGCEIGFWVFVLAGLVCRYLLRKPRLGAVLLMCTPLVDLALLIATIVELRSGVTATFVHGVAAIYIGVSIAFGHQMISRADGWFHHRYAGGPAPQPKAKSGPEHARRQRHQWQRHLAAYAIGCLLLLGMVWMVGDAARTESLLRTIQLWSIILGADFLYSFSYTLWPKKAA
ncbi:hypothetical protein [Paenibacillus gansuensis]|uniref:YmcC n=1 Tax=Paenibacillus gansuensis TaxID=306542 RepID=A0ABW5PI20_9BACL